MSLGLLGNKIGMTQIFDESGNIIPVTILKIGPCVVTQIKTILNKDRIFDIMYFKTSFLWMIIPMQTSQYYVRKTAVML